MSFVQHLYHQLEAGSGAPLVREIHGTEERGATGAELLRWIGCARTALRAASVAPGDRVVLVAANGIQWVAADLAILGEGAISVPLYARQDPAELVAMMHDCTPTHVWVGTRELAEAIREHWPEAPVALFEEVLAHDPVTGPPHAWSPDDGCTLVYTSGTSGPAKGAMLTVRGVDFMLPITASALEAMMALGGPVSGEHRVFHYLPFCFAGSRVVLWTCLWRGNSIMVSTDLDNLAEEMATAAPHYVLNVPMLLERIRGRVEEGLRGQPAPIRWLIDRAGALQRVPADLRRKRERLLLAVAERLVFRTVRQRIGRNLRCLICGSAPLSEETQRWFGMLGIPVYQVYGLTETTAIVTMDRPPRVKPGRVGTVLEGVQVRISDEGELQVNGPNVFAGYWERPEATEAAFDGGWFRTGDQVEVDSDGYWRIVGRVKNVLVPTSGHNVAPEPLEQRLLEEVEGVEQAVVVGHGRPYLAAVVTGSVAPGALDAGLASINRSLPHYRRIRKAHVAREPFTIENGQLTANRKLKRRVIEQAHAEAIEALYGVG